jgi:hypothetical protein
MTKRQTAQQEKRGKRHWKDHITQKDPGLCTAGGFRIPSRSNPGACGEEGITSEDKGKVGISAKANSFSKCVFSL